MTIMFNLDEMFDYANYVYSAKLGVEFFQTFVINCVLKILWKKKFAFKPESHLRLCNFAMFSSEFL